MTKKLTKKQQQFLILFAQNYSLTVIAKKQKISLTMLRKRLASILKYHKKEFNNARAIRKAYEKSRDSIKHAKKFSDLSNQEKYDIGIEHYNSYNTDN